MKHDDYLERLVNRLKEVDERPEDIRWIIKDGIWTPNFSTARHTLCDLIMVYHMGYGIPLELKGNPHKKHKALTQLHAGKLFIERELKLRVPYGKFVIYSNDMYIWEDIPFDER